VTHAITRPAPKLAIAPPGALHHLTQLDLARRWHISPRTLERWRWLGEGPAYLKLGRVIAYRLDDVETFEAAHRREHGPRIASTAPSNR
jgi:hypothetical protein